MIAGGEIPAAYREAGVEEARAAVKEREVVIGVSVGNGPGHTQVLGVDLSYDYVKINAEYST